MRIATVILSILICGAPLCVAQNESLLIGPGDLLHIQVLEAPDMTQNVRVMDSGEVPLIVGGAVKVAGLTPQAAAEAIRKDLVDQQDLMDPHVSVAIEQYFTQQVTVLGQVRTPGRFPLTAPEPILTVLAQAGGLDPSADRNITVQQRSTGKRINYFVSNDSNQALDSQLTIYPGDTLIVPKAKVVYVLGDVFRPGGFPMDTNDSQLTVMKAVALAGSPQLHARQGHTRLIRKQPNGSYVEIAVNLGDLEKGKRPDIPLQDDDIIYIPFSYAKNVALGLTNIVSAAGAAAVYTTTRP